MDERDGLCEPTLRTPHDMGDRWCLPLHPATIKAPTSSITKVLEPFGQRFSASEPFRPVKIHGIYAYGATVTVLWNGAGVTIVGTTYENTYAWFLTLDRGLIVDGIAFFDSIAFNELRK